MFKHNFAKPTCFSECDSKIGNYNCNVSSTYKPNFAKPNLNATEITE